MSEACKNCRFWRNQYYPQERGEYNEGNCRRYPPTVVLDASSLAIFPTIPAAT